MAKKRTGRRKNRSSRQQRPSADVANEDASDISERSDDDYSVDSFSSTEGESLTQTDANTKHRLVGAFALFGDSASGLVASFLLLIVAVGVSLWLDAQQTGEVEQQKLATTTASKSSLKSTQTDEQKKKTEKLYKALGPVPTIDPPKIFQVIPENGITSLVTDEIRNQFMKDGVVAVRGLLTSDEIQGLDQASNILVQEQRDKDAKRHRKRKGQQFYTMKMGPILLENLSSSCGNFTENENCDDIANTDDGNEEKDDYDISAGFRQVALFSAVPQFAAELLDFPLPTREEEEEEEEEEIDNNNQTVRLLRDILLAKDDELYVCGWHVDDTGFWPAIASSPGVNAWIAVDDMPVNGGGGFALAVGSHTAPWRDEAYYVTGSTQTFPPEGFKSAEDFFSNRTGGGTCNIKQSAPHLHRRLEETKRIYDMQKGDIIFHTRWLFHRTVPFDRSLVMKHRQEERAAALAGSSGDDSGERKIANKKNELLYRRYSVRYGPGNAEIPRGYGTELSVLWDPKNGGRTADEVAALDGPWYPQSYPRASENEIKRLRELIAEKLPVANRRREERTKEMQPFLKEKAARVNP